jgi:hypothetical protein
MVQEVLERTGRIEVRRRVLPARATVYFVLGLCLFGSAESAGAPGYRVVLRSLSNKLRHIPALAFQRLPTSSALTRARQRLGDKPLQVLFERLSGPLATTDLVSAFAFGLRLVAWDGTALDVPDTPANAAEFGFTGKNGVNQCANPQVRLMALIECGTHAVIDAAFDAVARFSEHALARRLLASLEPTMLLLADRNFAGYELWGVTRFTVCHSCIGLDPERSLHIRNRLSQGSVSARSIRASRPVGLLKGFSTAVAPYATSVVRAAMGEMNLEPAD